MDKPKLVLVGNGMAGARALEELLKIAPDLYEITVFGAEPHPNYNRIMLSPVLTGEQTVDDIVLHDVGWYAAHGIRLLLNRTVTRIDRARRLVHADDGTVAHYDRLLLATGSTPFILPVPGHGLDGVIGFRDIQDVQRMIAAAAQGGHAVVIGGGLLGLEAASGLAARGMRVSVAHLGATLLDRQLDDAAANLLRATLEARGLRFLMARQTDAILDDGHGRVRAVRFQDGAEIPADLVVMAVGIRPNVALARSCGLHVDRGIVVSDTLQTYDPCIYAVGECVSHRGVAYGLVAPLYEQARVAANHLARVGVGRYPGSVLSTKLKITGIDVFSAGDFIGGADTETITLTDPLAGIYKKLVLKADRLVGACLYGDTADGAWYLRLIREGRDVAALRDRLMCGEDAANDAGAASDAGHEPGHAHAARQAA
ncbi:assimilatory nitrite reductase large subunit [Achromobacter aloeverae]|uniref:Assimilatory nitrite reductase large subunit n=1 Tax=Achromobacter aloeverae TaxID=1750518 RepID=A0A4Q1HGF4_9BURK|nr:assimilatory nitrite reductase large subunit [Achromobacter aloeverae]